MYLHNITKLYEKHHGGIILSISAFFSLVFTNYSVIRHINFQSNAFDLGIYTQISYLYSRGLTPFSTIKNMPLLADHFEPILWIISPIYLLFPTAITLLIIQALAVSISAIPLYIILVNTTKSKLLSTLMIVSYLTSIGIVNAIKFDFHTTALAVLPLSLLLYAWHFKKWKLYWVALAVGFMVKEDVSLLTAGLGIYQLTTKQRKVGLITTTLSLSIFTLTKFIIMPFIWKGSDQGYISTSMLPLTSPADLIFLLITNPKVFFDVFFNTPIKQQTFTELYKTFGFLPLLSPLSWFTAFPMLFFRFSSIHTHFWSTQFHYNANIMPFLLISTAFVIKKWSFPVKPLCLLMGIMLLLYGLSPNSIIWESIQMKIHQHTKDIKKVMQQIPKNEAVSAQSPLLPHIANREHIYLFPTVSTAKFIILDQNIESYPIDKKDLMMEINKLENSKEWQIHTKEGSLIMFKKTEN